MKDTVNLHNTLQNIQEALGYFFNKNKDQVDFLLQGLLTNKERYGYMSCPCRLASGEKEKDRDIICPCIYREPDVKEYGSCYCGLYVSSNWNQKEMVYEHVPERRPPLAKRKSR